MGSRRKFDSEFKQDAVRLVIDGGRAVAEVARGLGIHENLLWKWKREYLNNGADAFPGKGRLKPEDEELRRLKRELADTREERDILKKALAVFSRHPE